VVRPYWPVAAFAARTLMVRPLPGWSDDVLKPTPQPPGHLSLGTHGDKLKDCANKGRLTWQNPPGSVPIRRTRDCTPVTANHI